MQMFDSSRYEPARWIRLMLGLYCGILVLTAQAEVPDYSPYSQAKSNQLYNRLFCDSLSGYRQLATVSHDKAWQVLFSDPADITQLGRLAQSPTASSCQQLLAYHLLHKLNASPQKTRLLGVVVEVAFDDGMDTLAAYRDGHVFYIHRDGKIKTITKNDRRLSGNLHKLFQEAQLVVENTQYWPKSRLNPPPPGQVRLSFLASDGIHFGQGSMHQLELNPLAGPVLTAATELLVKLTSQ